MVRRFIYSTVFIIRTQVLLTVSIESQHMHNGVLNQFQLYIGC